MFGSPFSGFRGLGFIVWLTFLGSGVWGSGLSVWLTFFGVKGSLEFSVFWGAVCLGWGVGRFGDSG